MRWAPADYLLDAFVVRCYRRGDYRTLAFYSGFLFRSHLEGGSLPADIAVLADYLLMKERDVQAALTVCVEASKLVVSDGRVSHKRVAQDLERERAFRREQSELGRKGAAKRWGPPHLDDRGPHSGSDGQPAPLPVPTPTPSPDPAPTPDPTNGSAPAVDAAQRSAYVRDVWSEWCRLLGADKQASSTEYALACRWHDSGIPLRAVLTAMEETLARGTKPRSLTYLDGAVKDEAERTRRAMTL